MMKSNKPRKQRKRNFNARLHEKQNMMCCCVSKEFAKEIGKKTLGVRKGDEVKVMRGDYAGTVGKVSKISLDRMKVYVEGIKTKKTGGGEAQVPIHPSNLMITKGDMADKMRQKFALKRKR